MRKALILGTIIDLILAIIWIVTGSNTLLFLIAISVMVIATCGVLASSKKTGLLLASLMVLFAITAIFTFHQSEKEELIRAKEHVVAEYQPQQTVDNIQAYRKDRYYGYGILNKPEPTTGVGYVDWSAKNFKPDARYDVSDDVVFVDHVERAITFSEFALIVTLFAILALIVQIFVLRYGAEIIDA